MFLFWWFIITLLIFAVILPFIIIGATGDVYYPAGMNKVKIMLDLIGKCEGLKVYDLGSGDGRIVYEFARKGANAVGVEVNPILYLFSIVWVKLKGLNNTRFKCESFWNTKVSDADIIAIFIIPKMLPRMFKKLKKELEPGTKVVSYAFEFPDFKLLKQRENVYLYEV